MIEPIISPESEGRSMITLIRTFALLVCFTVVAAFGGIIAGLVITAAGMFFYQTGFQLPVSFYASIVFIIWSIGKYQLDRSEYKPKPEEVPAPIPSPRNFRKGPLIVMS
jgi:hypothetical protein